MNLPLPEFDPSTGLAPAIIQSAGSGEVLMLGYISEESWRMTAETGLMHFFSRSRQRLWKKGETSGNVLHVIGASIDCDADAVLVRVNPEGPTCHRGTRTCFDSTGDPRCPPGPFEELATLWGTISARVDERPEGSYTARLVDGGVDAVGRKVVEEATEVLLAARDHRDGGDALRVHEEVADLLYHVLVLVAERGLDPADTMAVLTERAR